MGWELKEPQTEIPLARYPTQRLPLKINRWSGKQLQGKHFHMFGRSAEDGTYRETCYKILRFYTLASESISPTEIILFPSWRKNSNTTFLFLPWFPGSSDLNKMLICNDFISLPLGIIMSPFLYVVFIICILSVLLSTYTFCYNFPQILFAYN